MTFQEMNLP